MGVIAEGILRGCQGLVTPLFLGYPLSVFNKNSTLKGGKKQPPQTVELSEYQKKILSNLSVQTPGLYRCNFIVVVSMYIQVHNHSRVGSCHSWDTFKSALFPDSRRDS